MTKLVSKTRAWKKVAAHYKHFKDVEMRDLFDDDKKRAEKFTINLDNLILDYSKNRISERTMKHLFRLAHDCHVEEMIQAMFRGDKINTTEKRAVLHVALRNRQIRRFMLTAKTLCRRLTKFWQRCSKFSEAGTSGTV